MYCMCGDSECNSCGAAQGTLLEVEGNPDSRVQKLLEDLSMAFECERVDYAVGGGMALLAYGVRRMTSDVDFFFDPKDEKRVIHLAQQIGLRVRSVASPFHFVAFRGEDNPNWNPTSREMPEIRADLLFPAGDPELSAVEFPDVVRIGGVRVNIFPVELLVAAKFSATSSNDPGMRLKHESDIAQLLTREAFSPAKVEKMIRRYDREEARRFGIFVRSLTKI